MCLKRGFSYFSTGKIDKGIGIRGIWNPLIKTNEKACMNEVTFLSKLLIVFLTKKRIFF